MKTNKLTLATVRTALNAMGVRIISGGGEYQVKLKGPEHAGTGYFTDDLQDAFDTGKQMASDELARKHAVALAKECPKLGQACDTRETFAQYLARVGKDQAESGREFTAEDYAKASARIQRLETVLHDMALKLDEVVTSRNMDSTLQEFFMVRSARDWARAMTADSNVYLHLN